LIDTITTSLFYLQFKENNENYMTSQVFWAVFIPADGRASAAISPPIFPMAGMFLDEKGYSTHNLMCVRKRFKIIWSLDSSIALGCFW
jgi:hypothetical protein